MVQLAATAAIRERFSGQRRMAAIAVYEAIVEASNARRARAFEAPRREIARLAGCSADTLDRYVRVFVEIGVLAVERRVEAHPGGTLNLPNVWALVDVDAPGGGRTGAATLAALTRPPSPHGRGQGGRTGAAVLSRARDSEEEVLKDPPNPPRGGRARDRVAYLEQVDRFAAGLFPDADPVARRGYVGAALARLQSDQRPATREAVYQDAARWLLPATDAEDPTMRFTRADGP